MCADTSIRLRRSLNFWTRLLIATALLALGAPAHAAEKITYYHLDALSSPVAATDELGNVVWKETYAPYGDRLQKAPAAASNDRWYTGKPYDSDVGLSYFGARWYDPSIGRFMGVDPQSFSEQDPHSFNRYAYGNNNPYKYVDPNGQWVVGALFWAAGVGVAIYEMSKPVPLDAYHDSAIQSIPTFPGPVGGVGAGARVGASVGKGLERVANRTVSKIEDVTKSGSKLPNIRTDVSKGEFEKNLLDDGFSKSASKDGKVNDFSKGDKRYTTRDFSKSTDGPTAEVFKNGQPVSKIRLGDE